MHYVECMLTFGANGETEIDFCIFSYSCDATSDATKAIMHIAANEVVIIILDNLLVR